MIPLGTCPFCEEDRFLDLLEYWPDERAFMLDTCCEAGYEDLVQGLEAALEMPLHQRVRYLRPLRQLFQGYGIPFRMTFTIGDGRIHWDDGLEVRPLTGDAKRIRRWIGRHHRHNRPPVAWLEAWGAFSGPKLVAVGILARPVARKLAEKGILEVTRVCTRTDVEPELTFNASSQLYSTAAAAAKRRGAPKVVTYTLFEEETGASLRAAGWTPEHVTRAESWDRPSRPRPNSPPSRRKVRWSKLLRPAAQLALPCAV